MCVFGKGAGVCVCARVLCMGMWVYIVCMCVCCVWLCEYVYHVYGCVEAYVYTGGGCVWGGCKCLCL